MTKRLLIIFALFTAAFVTSGNRVVHRVVGGAGASFSDDFNRANETPLAGPNWEAPIGTWSDVNLNSNGIVSTATGGGTVKAIAMVSTSAATFAANQTCSVTFSTNLIGGPAVRIQGGSNGGCYWMWHVGSNLVGVFKVTDNGGGWSEAQVGSYQTMTNPTAGDILTLEVTGGATTTLTPKLNGVASTAVTDSSSPYTSGQPGVHLPQSENVTAMSAADL